MEIENIDDIFYGYTITEALKESIQDDLKAIKSFKARAKAMGMYWYVPKIWIRSHKSFVIMELKTDANNIYIPAIVNELGDPTFKFYPKKYPDNIVKVYDRGPDHHYSDFELFDECEKLEDIRVDQNNEFFCDIDGVLFNKDKTVLIKYPYKKKAEHYVIPDTVKTISPKAFNECENLHSVEFPKSLEKIADQAFLFCSNITSVVLPDSLTYMGNHIFFGTGIPSWSCIKMPPSLKFVGKQSLHYMVK